MRYYPVLLDCKGRCCCVVGGGAVAGRKAVSLLKAGARVTVISPRLGPRLSALASAGRLRHVARQFAPGMLKGCFLAIAATDDRGVNHAVSAAAQKAGMPVNVVDDPAASTFIVPSVIDRGGLTISISTGGKAPCLSRKIRLDLEKRFVPGYAAQLKRVSRERIRLKAAEPDIAKRKKALSRLVKVRPSREGA